MQQRVQLVIKRWLATCSRALKSAFPYRIFSIFQLIIVNYESIQGE